MFTSKTSRSLLIFSLAATFALRPMELTNASHMDCHLKIAKPYLGGSSVRYLDSKDHHELWSENHIKSSLKNPMLHVKITTLQKNKMNVYGGTYMDLPARLFHGLNDGSKLSIYFANGADLTFEDKPLYISALCIKCEKKKKLTGSTFAEQFNAMINKFYRHPSFSLSCNTEELINALVVSESKKCQVNEKGSVTTITYSHGPNGISSKEAFEKLIAEYESDSKKITECESDSEK